MPPQAATRPHAPLFGASTYLPNTDCPTCGRSSPRAICPHCRTVLIGRGGRTGATPQAAAETRRTLVLHSTAVLDDLPPPAPSTSVRRPFMRIGRTRDTKAAPAYMTAAVSPAAFRAMPIPEAARAPASVALARAAAARADLAAHAQTVAGMAAVAAADATSARPTPLDMYLDAHAARPPHASRSAAASSAAGAGYGAGSLGYGAASLGYGAGNLGAGYAADRPLRDEHGRPIDWTRGPAIMTEIDCKAILAKSLEEAVTSIRLAQRGRYRYGWLGNTLAAVLGAATCAGAGLAARHYGYDLPAHAARWMGMGP